MKLQKHKQRHRKTTRFDIRKNFYKRLLYIGLGVIIFLLFMNESGPLRFVGGVGFCLALYNLLLVVGMSLYIVDDFFPPKTYNEKRAKPFDKFMYYFASGLFGFGMLFLVFELKTIDNTLNGVTLFWRAGGCGVGVAVLVTVLLKLLTPSVYDESKRRYMVHFGLFVGLFLLAAALGSFINHRFADNQETCVNYTVIRKGTGGKRNKSSYLFIKVESLHEERFEVSRDFYNEVIEGAPVKLCIQKGQLGFDFVTTFKNTGGL